MAKKKKTTKKTTKQTMPIHRPTVAPGSAGSLVPTIPQELRLVHDKSDRQQTESDVLSVLLVRGEAMIQAKLEIAIAEHLVASGLADVVGREVGKAVSEVADAKADEAKEAFLGATDLLGFFKISKVVCHGGASEPDEMLSRPGQYTPMRVTISITAFKGSGVEPQPLLQRAVFVKTPPSLVSLLRKRTQAQQDARGCYEGVLAWKKKLANMAKFERVSRAQLAENRIRDNADAGFALDTLLTHLDATIEDL